MNFLLASFLAEVDGFWRRPALSSTRQMRFRQRMPFRLYLAMLLCVFLRVADPMLAETSAESWEVKTSELHLLGVRDWWPNMEFDSAGEMLSLSWTTWATNQNFTEILHYAIVATNGAIICGSETNQDNALVEKFPRLALKRFHPELICHAKDTNMFLDDYRWAVWPDSSACVRSRQINDEQDEIECWQLKPRIEKRWGFSLAGKTWGSPYSQVKLIRLQGKEVVAVSCSFSETILLEPSNGKELDRIPFAQAGEAYTALSTCLVPERGWLICGKGNSQRLRVLDLVPPHKLVREVGIEKAGHFGAWSVPRLEPFLNGRYLLKEAHWGSRLMGGQITTTIIDLNNWEEVWRSEYRGAEAIVISPHGNRMAIRRGSRLQLRPLPLFQK